MKRRPLVILLIASLIVAPTPPSLAEDQGYDVSTLGLLWENFGGHNATLWNVRWSPDGSMLSGAFFDETVTIFDAATGDIIYKISPYDGTSGRDDCKEDSGSRCWGGKDSTIEEYWPIRVTAWSPDGEYLAVGGDKANVTLYHTSNWSFYRTLEGYKGSVQSMDWSSDGQFLATGTGTDKVDMHNLPENEVWVWNTTTWEKEAVLRGHSDAVLDVRWSPNDTRLASASDDKSIRIWDRSTWKLEKILLGHTLGVLDVAWSPDGMTLVSGSRDYKINTWSYEDGNMTGRFREANCVRSVDFHPSGDFFANSGVDEVQLKIRDAATGSVLKSFTDGMETKSDIMSSRWSPDGTSIAAVAGKEHAMRVYSLGKDRGIGEKSDVLKRVLPRLIVFSVVIVVAVAVTYYPLFRIRKEGGY